MIVAKMVACHDAPAVPSHRRAETRTGQGGKGAMHPCPTSYSAYCKAKQSFDGKNSMNARNVRDCECCMNLELINGMVEVLTAWWMS